ncbi:MAG: hypothetical protein ACJAYU_000553 [Bradymonadia bacterium]|jgi:hypothetical protein
MRITWIFLALAVLTAACGGRQREPEGGEEILLGDVDLMGELEERALGYLLDLAFLLENDEDPQAVVDRVEAMLAVNGEEMLENAESLEAKFASLEGRERRMYEAQLAAHLDEALQGWFVALQRFKTANADEGRAVAQMVEALDQ